MHKPWSRIFSLILALPLLLTMFAACGAGTGDNGSGGGTVTIKIGTDFPTSGDDQSAGLPAQNGAQLAVDEANQQNFLPGYKFVFVPKNDVGPSGTHDGGVAQRNINDLIGDPQVAGVVGPLNSSIAQAIMPAANNAGLAVISPSNSNDCLTQETPPYECTGTNSLIAKLRPSGQVTYFRTATLDQYQGAALADYAYKTLKLHTAYVIDDTETYGAGLAKNFVYFFKNDGGTIAGQVSAPKETTSYDNILTTAASSHPDLIFFGGNDSTGAISIRQQMAKVAGLENTPFMVGDGSKTIKFAQTIVPLKGAAVYGSVPGIDPSQVSKAKTFLDNYKKAKFGTAGAYSGGAYDDAWILLNAIKSAINDKKATPPASANDTEAARPFREAVVNAIKTVSYDGVTGKQTFDANGDTKNKSISIYTLGDTNVADGWKYLTAVQPQ